VHGRRRTVHFWPRSLGTIREEPTMYCSANRSTPVRQWRAVAAAFAAPLVLVVTPASVHAYGVSADASAPKRTAQTSQQAAQQQAARTTQRSSYERAFGACMEARGYVVR
jgi:hypothetical protein